MKTNKRIIVWSDRPPFFTKTPFLTLAKKGYEVFFLCRRNDNQTDRGSVHVSKSYDGLVFLNCRSIISSKKACHDFLTINDGAIHVVNGFYIPNFSYLEAKKICPNSRFFILTEKPQSFKKPYFLSNFICSLKCFFKAAIYQKYIEGVLAFGEDACHFFCKHGWKDEKVHNFIYSFDFDTVTLEKAKNIKASRFLYIGRFDFHIKGVNYLLKAIELFESKKEDFTFDFAGGYGLNSNEIKEFIGKNKHCNYIGNIMFDNIFKLVSSYDCIVVPSIKDGWNINVLIGLCCGRPVIATNGSGSEALIKKFDFGLVVEKKDANSLSNAFKMMTDSNVYIKFSENAFKASKYFTNDLLCDYTESIFKKEIKDLY